MRHGKKSPRELHFRAIESHSFHDSKIYEEIHVPYFMGYNVPPLFLVIDYLKRNDKWIK